MAASPSTFTFLFFVGITNGAIYALIALGFTLSYNSIGLINLFPIPMLDGGHIVLYGIEAARGRPLTERSQEIAFRFGLAMVLLMIWRPRGLIGHRAPTVFLHHNQAISSDLVKEGHG